MYSTQYPFPVAFTQLNAISYSMYSTQYSFPTACIQPRILSLQHVFNPVFFPYSMYSTPYSSLQHAFNPVFFPYSMYSTQYSFPTACIQPRILFLQHALNSFFFLCNAHILLGSYSVLALSLNKHPRLGLHVFTSLPLIIQLTPEVPSS
jgi:hypothetical protein